MTDDIPNLAEALAEIERLRARVLELEAELAATRGTLARSPEPAPFTVTDAPTTTPR